jgi:hypothetical protein
MIIIYERLENGLVAISMEDFQKLEEENEKLKKELFFAKDCYKREWLANDAEKERIEEENKKLKSEKDFFKKIAIKLEEYIRVNDKGNGKNIVESLLKEVNEFSNANNHNRKPHKCPVCNGNARVIDDTILYKECNVCCRTGIVWEPK